MAIMENLRRGEGEDPGSGKYNPFRILEIGESMIRYCDGIRIKDYNFLAILTSDRENNPFLFLVSLRAGFETCSFLRIESALSEMSDCGAATTPPDFALSYLFTLTQFSHFLC